MPPAACACNSYSIYIYTTQAHPGRIIINLLTRLLALSRLSSPRAPGNTSTRFQLNAFSPAAAAPCCQLGAWARQVLRLASMPRETMPVPFPRALFPSGKWVSDWSWLLHGWKPNGRFEQNYFWPPRSDVSLLRILRGKTLANHLHFKGTKCTHKHTRLSLSIRAIYSQEHVDEQWWFVILCAGNYLQCAGHLCLFFLGRT
jgi:hypothetical protein